MAQPRQVRLPNMLRNPIVAEEIAVELAEWADELEKRAAASGRQIRERPRIRKIRAVSTQLARAAEARIGNQADGDNETDE